MASPEAQLTTGWEKTKRVIRASAATLSLGIAACSSPSTEAQPPASIAPTLTERAPVTTTPEDKAWGNALNELRGKIDRGESVTLLVPDRPLCIYWPSSVQGAYTVQRNPVMYAYREGNISLSFFPFVGRKKDVPPFVMNGPYQSQHLDSKNQPIPGSEYAYGEVVVPEGEAFIFLSREVKLVLEQEEPADVFTAGWMVGDDGIRYAETKVVLEEDLESAFPDCKITPPGSLEQPDVHHI